MPEQSFLDALLEEMPDMLYGAMRPQTRGAGRGWGFLDYWRGQQGRIYQDYLSQLGRTALGGQIPTLTYRSFLGNYPWLQSWLGMAPEERGERAQRFAPRMRWSL